MGKKHLKMLKSLTKPKSLKKKPFNEILNEEIIKDDAAHIPEQILDSAKYLWFKKKNWNYTMPTLLSALLVCVLLTYQNCGGGDRGAHQTSSLSSNASSVAWKGSALYDKEKLEFLKTLQENYSCNRIGTNFYRRLSEPVNNSSAWYGITGDYSLGDVLTKYDNGNVYVGINPYSYEMIIVSERYANSTFLGYNIEISLCSDRLYNNELTLGGSLKENKVVEIRPVNYLKFDPVAYADGIYGISDDNNIELIIRNNISGALTGIPISFVSLSKNEQIRQLEEYTNVQYSSRTALSISQKLSGVKCDVKTALFYSETENNFPINGTYIRGDKLFRYQARATWEYYVSHELRAYVSQRYDKDEFVGFGIQLFYCKENTSINEVLSLENSIFYFYGGSSLLHFRIQDLNNHEGFRKYNAIDNLLAW